MKIDHLSESLFELEGAHYLYRDAMAARFRGAGDGSTRAEQVEELRAQLRAAVADLRKERRKAAKPAAKKGEWTPQHMAWLDRLLGDDVERVKRNVGVLGFE